MLYVDYPIYIHTYQKYHGYTQLGKDQHHGLGPNGRACPPRLIGYARAKPSGCLSLGQLNTGKHSCFRSVWLV